MTIYYAVIDTNVVVSSFLKRDSIPNEIVQMSLNGPIIPLLNEEIINEYQDVLLRNKFGFSEETIKTFIEELMKRGVFLDRTQADELFSDQDDVVFYEIVLTARTATNAYLITGNKKHFPIKPFVVTPNEMLQIMKQNATQK